MGRIEADLSRYSLVAIDTPVFIYHFEKNQIYFNLTKEIFSKLDDDQLDFAAVTSVITLLEISVKPIKEKRAHQVIFKYIITLYVLYYDLC